MKFIISILRACIFCFSCKSVDNSESMPTYVRSKIENIQKETVRNPPAEVWEWNVKGQMYYYFNSPCCDQYNYLYNDACEIMCAPDGDFTRKGDQDCPDFGDSVVKKLLWKDIRK